MEVREFVRKSTTELINNTLKGIDNNVAEELTELLIKNNYLHYGEEGSYFTEVLKSHGYEVHIYYDTKCSCNYDCDCDLYLDFIDVSKGDQDIGYLEEKHFVKFGEFAHILRSSKKKTESFN